MNSIFRQTLQLAAILFIGFLVGCSNNDSNTPTPSTAPPTSPPENTESLKDVIVTKNKYIGTILNINFFNGSGNESAYTPTVLKEFNAVVAENNHKMSFMIPNEPVNDDGSFNWNFTIDDLNKDAIDAMANFGGTDMIKRGHALIWYNEVPDWLLSKTINAPAGTEWTKQQIYDFAEQYITILVDYTEGKFDEWDLFNEAISDSSNPRAFRRETWYDNVGPTDQDIQDFIDHCFTVANAVDSNNEIQFFYNDYNIEVFNADPNSKNAFMRSLVQGMKDRSIGIDGVGLQSHFISGAVNVDGISQNMDTIIAMGLVCNITELDLRICNNGATPTSAELTTQANDYRNIVSMALNKAGSTGLVFWGFTDKHTWIPNFGPPNFAGCNSPLLFDESYRIKPSYTAVLEALKDL